MHRAYPANNKLLKKRWDQSRFDTHRKKVENAKAVIDNQTPKTYVHLHCKLKKFQMEAERLATVERDNRILMEKMSFIMRSQGPMDNNNNVPCTNLSLNKTTRKRDILRITHENQAILRRISSKAPYYHRRKWLEEWMMVNQKYMANIAAYPHTWKNVESTAEGLQWALSERDERTRAMKEKRRAEEASADKSD